MRTTAHILILMVIPATAFATEQEPDVLFYDGLELFVRTGWGHPSPLQTYYYQNNLAYPFPWHSTANYRGHVAVWNIQEDGFHLSDIQIHDYVRDPNGSYERVVESHEPNEFGVEAHNRPPSENGDVPADWFSGILDCYLIDEGTYTSYFFHIRDGNVVDTQVINREDYEILYNSPEVDALSEDLKSKYHMLTLNENYITYYYRLNEDDTIEYEGQDCRLVTGFDRLSPIYEFYDNSHLKWPYNWENTEKCGAPHCQWRIENDKVYLTGVTLYSGLSFYTIDAEPLDLTTLLDDNVVDGVVLADWVNGVYVIEHGYATEESAGWPGYTFTVFNVTALTYIRIAEGLLIESYTVPKDFDPENVPANADPGLKQMVEDYQLPSVFSTPSTPSEGEQDQAVEPPAGDCTVRE